jgi:quercetin dioxygenase-like cupin family protein
MALWNSAIFRGLLRGIADAWVLVKLWTDPLKDNPKPVRALRAVQRRYPGARDKGDPDRRASVEFLSRMMDGSIFRDAKDRLDPVLSGFAGGHEGAAKLKEVPIFEGCSQRQLRSVARIARVFEAPAGTVLTRVGDPGDEFFLILDGTVSVDVSAGRPVLLRPGEFFGEMSLLDGDPRSATVVTDTPVRLLVIHRGDFSFLRREVPELTQILLVTLSRRVRQAEARAERMSER